jgi:hypothetical protein
MPDETRAKAEVKMYSDFKSPYADMPTVAFDVRLRGKSRHGASVLLGFLPAEPRSARSWPVLPPPPRPPESERPARSS